MQILIKLLPCLTIAALLAAPCAWAQSSRASVRGLVTDQAGAPAAGAAVRVARGDTGESREAGTDADGRFSFPELEVGEYRIDVTLKGYGTYTRQAQLTVGLDLWLDVPLAVAVRQDVDVSAPFVPIDRDSAALGTLIDQRQVSGLPLDGRNFLELALLAPGTTPAPQGSASSVRGDFAFSANGGREDANAYLLDGVYNMDPKLGTPGVRPPVDGIHEFAVEASTYDASFGRNGSAQINVVSRAGANRFAGSVYDFFRNGALDKRNAFAPRDAPAPDYNRHQFGGSIGGPIAADRAFFFADYEHTRLREGITRVTNVPTLAERGGDFSESLFSRPVDPFSRQPFPGGRIPPFALSPIGSSLAALYPLPNRATPFANYVASPTAADDVHQFDVRADHSFPGASRLTARYSFSDRRLLEPFAGAGFSSLPGFGNHVDRRGQNLSLAYSRPVGSALVNDLRLGFNRVAIEVLPENPQVDNASVGLPSLATDPRDAGLSLVSVAGYSALGQEYNNPQASASDTLQLRNTTTWVRGAHLVKFGGEWYGVRQSAYRDIQARGFLTFIDQGYTGNALSDLLLGLPVLTGGARLDNPQNLRAHSWSLFAHDDWRAGPSLTISAGLRYDFISPAVDRDDRANLYDAATGQLVQVGTAGMPRGGHQPDRNNVAPRAGFAWTVDQSARTVLRGGYGIYYNQGALATSEGLYFNPPYFNLGVYFPDPRLPLLTLANPFPSSFPVFIPQSATAYQRDLQTPWMEHWNLNVQRQYGTSGAIEVAYVGSRGHDLISARDLNQPAASPVPNNLRPNPMFADITLIESRASSRYNALQVKYQQRASQGMSLLFAYTLGKSTDDASGFFTSSGDPNFPQDSFDPGAERGRSSFDVRHRFSAGFAYELPLGTSVWLRDMEVQGVITLQSGRPFTVALRPDVDNSNTGRSNLGFGYNDRPDLTGDAELDSPTAQQWFNRSAFSQPAFGSFGSAGRNILTGPDYKNVNLALIKYVPLGTTVRLQLRAEAFNLLNRTNLDLPDAYFGSPTFGQVLSAGSPRRIQFGVRAVF
jgi:hypothetical protein